MVSGLRWRWVSLVFGVRLARPVVGLARTTLGKGYWLVAADGGVFSRGDARFFGSTASSTSTVSTIGIIAASGGGGYALVRSNGAITNFGSSKA